MNHSDIISSASKQESSLAVNALARISLAVHDLSNVIVKIWNRGFIATRIRNARIMKKTIRSLYHNAAFISHRFIVMRNSIIQATGYTDVTPGNSNLTPAKRKKVNEIVTSFIIDINGTTSLMRDDLITMMRLTQGRDYLWGLSAVLFDISSVMDECRSILGKFPEVKENK